MGSPIKQTNKQKKNPKVVVWNKVGKVNSTSLRLGCAILLFFYTSVRKRKKEKLGKNLRNAGVEIRSVEHEFKALETSGAKQDDKKKWGINAAFCTSNRRVPLNILRLLSCRTSQRSTIGQETIFVIALFFFLYRSVVRCVIFRVDRAWQPKGLAQAPVIFIRYFLT